MGVSFVNTLGFSWQMASIFLAGDVNELLYKQCLFLVRNLFVCLFPWGPSRQFWSQLWSGWLHCSCVQSWPGYPGDLHLNLHVLSWFSGLLMDLPHTLTNRLCPTLASNRWLHPTTDEWFHHWLADLLLTWPACFTLDLPRHWGLLWQSGLFLVWRCYHKICSNCHVQVPHHPCWWGHHLCLCLPCSAPGSPSCQNLWFCVLPATGVKPTSIGRLKEAGWSPHGQVEECVQQSILTLWKKPTLVKMKGIFCMKSSGSQISSSDEYEFHFKWSLLQKTYSTWHRIVIDMTIGEYLLNFFLKLHFSHKPLWCRVAGLQYRKKITLLINKFYM